MMPSRTKVEISIATVAGMALVLSKMDGMEDFYFQGLYELATETLAAWPKQIFRNRRLAMNYIKRVEHALEAGEKVVQGAFSSMAMVLNFMLALISLRYDELRFKGSRRAMRLLPLIDMIEQYIETFDAARDWDIESGASLMERYHAAIEAAWQ